MCVFFKNMFTYCKVEHWSQAINKSSSTLSWISSMGKKDTLTIWGLNDYSSPSNNNETRAASSLQLALSRLKTVIQCNAVGCIASQEYLRLHGFCLLVVFFGADCSADLKKLWWENGMGLKNRHIVLFFKTHHISNLVVIIPRQPGHGRCQFLKI